MTPPEDPASGWPRDEFDEDLDPGDRPFGDDGDPAPPAWFPGQHLPDHARRLGLTHHVPEGALLDFAGKLDSTKPLHRVTAWVMLAVFATPVLFYVLRLLGSAYPG